MACRLTALASPPVPAAPPRAHAASTPPRSAAAPPRRYTDAASAALRVRRSRSALRCASTSASLSSQPAGSAPEPPPLSFSAPALLGSTWALLRTGWVPLAALSLAAAATEQAVGAACFALLWLASAPADSPLTLVAGVSGVLAGFALSVYCRGAALTLLRAVAEGEAEERARAAGAAAPAGSAAASRLSLASQRARRLWQLFISRPPPPPTAVLLAELRRLLSLAWAWLPTFPLPLFAVFKVLDLALLQPALALGAPPPPLPPDPATGKAQKPVTRVDAAFTATLDLTRGRLRPLSLAFMGVLALQALLLAAWLLTLILAVPTLPPLLLPLPLPATVGTAAGDQAGAIAVHFASGAAFARVFEAGGLKEQGALTLALLLGTLQRWGCVAALRALAFEAWRRADRLGPLPVKKGWWGKLSEGVMRGKAAVVGKVRGWRESLAVGRRAQTG